MRTAENVNAPWLGGWLIGAAAGLVAFGALVAVGKFDLFPAAAIGSVVALVVGLILGMPWGAGARPAAAAMPAPVRAAEAAPVVTPAAFVSAPAAPVAASADGPERLSAPRGGKADDLKEIEGIGPAMEKLVNEMGFYHFAQIANWSDADVAWVDANMKNFKGRITRDRWVAQAKIIVAEGLEAFRERAKTNNY
ncbi:NADH:ubiquinone oxidoreductase [Rhodobacter sp. SY28-1]|uniref:NADH:ubiquinone oxidoreductase n=1 Tax=Rhodobacter sp. SY28-1 TaxID=2562317 RepID=UPI0010BFB1C6|nr:NADH:ubiquinone oxidoreductase [Rhodobacter sp. SY28-1]